MYRRNDKLLKDGKPAFTIYDILAKDPCEEYPEERLLELWGDEDALTADEVAALDIREADILWALRRVCMTHVQQVMFVAGCCEAILAHSSGYGDDRRISAGRLIDTLRLYACGLFSAQALRHMCLNFGFGSFDSIQTIIAEATQDIGYAVDVASLAMRENPATRKDRLRIALFFANL